MLTSQELSTRNESFILVQKDHGITNEIFIFIQALMEKVFSEPRLSLKRLSFMKFHLEQKFGTTWQIIELNPEYEHGQWFVSNEGMNITFKMKGSTFIVWKTKILIEN